MNNDEIFSHKLFLLGKFTASLIHEIRNPLSVIKMNLEFLNMLKNEIPAEANDSIQSCIEATNRMIFLIENFSDFSKKHPSELSICNVNEITQVAVNISQVNASRFNLYIETDLSPSIPSIYFHKDKMLHVFLNLLNNAIEADNKSDKIYVRTYLRTIDDKQKIVWEIEDSGTGIDYELGDKIFSDFFTSKKKGTGLGLGVCKMLLEQYNAEIHFESEPGKGTKFFVFFDTSSLRNDYAKQNTDN